MNNELINVAVIGGGAAGLSAAQYAARANLNTVVFEKIASGGQCLLIDNLENYPGILSVDGFAFSSILKQQAENFGVKFFVEEIVKISKENNEYFCLESIQKKRYHAQTVIAATGAQPRWLGIAGEKEFIGKGVSTCATCDGPFFKNKKVLVVGGGDAACDEATFLSKLTDQIVMIHRRNEFRAQKAVAQRVLDNKNIRVLWNTELKEIHGKTSVESVTLYQNQTKAISQINTSGVFVLIGSNPQTGVFTIVERDNGGHLVTDAYMKTNIPGLFAVGDVRNTPFRQIVTACSDGAIAAHQADCYIRDLKK